METFTKRKTSKDTLTRNRQGTNHKQVPVKKSVPASSGSIPLIQRKSLCPCDGGCPRCTGMIEPKLTADQPGYIYEREAERFTDGLKQKTEPTGGDWISGTLLRQMVKSSSRPHIPKELQHRLTTAFGSNVSNVDFHEGPGPHQTAEALGASAFTIGRDIFLSDVVPSLSSSEGENILAHEVAHALADGRRSSLQDNRLSSARHDSDAEVQAIKAAQQFSKGELIGSLQPYSDFSTIYLADYNISGHRIHVDYGNICYVPVSDIDRSLGMLFNSLTGSPPDMIISNLASLMIPQKRWLLKALDLLLDNPAGPGFNSLEGVNRLIGFIRSAPSIPTGRESAYQVLRVSGWLEHQIISSLNPPTQEEVTGIQEIHSPPTTPGTTDALQVDRFRSLLKASLYIYLRENDPAGWGTTGTHNLSALQNISDEIQSIAEEYFSPFVQAAHPAVYMTSGWRYSANLADWSTYPIDQSSRLSFLRNRASLVGADSDTANHRWACNPSIFEQTRFNGSRPGDQKEIDIFVQRLDTDSEIQAMVTRNIRTAGRTINERVYISTIYDAARNTSCRARWAIIELLCHELLHVLQHRDFSAAADSEQVHQSQVLREGFTEWLGDRLYTHIRSRAQNDPLLRERMEDGINCGSEEIPLAVNAYGPAGEAAWAIRRIVGAERFRAAYFLGAVEMIGLTRP